MGPYTTTTDTEATSTPYYMDPVQRLRRLDCTQSTPTNTIGDTSPELASYTQSFDVLNGSPSTPKFSRREYCSSESGSPTRVQSPLRYSISNAEPPALPFPFPAEVGTTDPTKSPVDRSSSMSFTGDRRRRSSRPSWPLSTDLEASPETTPTRNQTPKQMPASEPSKTPKTGSPTATSTASRFGFLSTAFKGLTSSSPSSPSPADENDDLINLNIEQTLHSMTSLTDSATFSPAAFKNLQMVATGMLHKFQDAYTQRTMEVRELKAEKVVQADEQSETETRMQHLKMQLEGMAQKAAEQEEMMQALMSELAREKRLRTELSGSMSGGSSVSEDLAVEQDQRKKWRKSGATSRSDTSYDTDDEEVEEASVFSARSRSPTIATVMSDLSPLEPPTSSPLSYKASSLAAPTRTSRAQPAQMTAFQKLFKGLSVENPKEAEAVALSSCRNCQGQDVSVAWDTVSLLKDENKGLKERVGDLEVAVEGALDAVNLVGL
ncbi:hypothetical protein LIA77_10219 [Sarocladium implicatum]|nr:hypothetical protein LIA77_10219 [Sarocladium implicatum]